MSARTFRCRIARRLDGFVQTMTYIGPLDAVPEVWSIVMRKVALRSAA